MTDRIDTDLASVRAEGRALLDARVVIAYRLATIVGPERAWPEADALLALFDMVGLQIVDAPPAAPEERAWAALARYPEEGTDE